MDSRSSESIDLNQKVITYHLIQPFTIALSAMELMYTLCTKTKVYVRSADMSMIVDSCACRADSITTGLIVF